ncbi:MAG TPA: WecB/TagA/CpsF family glycosyltransferase [Patescibacteria group bacterium]|nr:WecB/TagA/CpsF family glycosyltransferase [Patescibacteria group bacterium]
MSRRTFDLLGVKLDNISLIEAEEKLVSLVESGQKSIITTPNTEFIIRAQVDEEFRNILNKQSRLNLPDSYGVLWAARFLTLPVPKNKYLKIINIPIVWFLSLIFLPIIPKIYHNPLQEKISGSDFIWSIAKVAAKNKYRIFLFGGAVTVAERAALKLQTDVHDLRIAGVYHGDMTTPTDEIIEAINHSRADIILVCLGSPLQERWLAENLAKTCCNVGVGLGGTFDFIAKIVPRAPLWMRQSGLEWLYRLFIEPRRLRRQLALPKLAWLVLKNKLLSN